MEEETKGMVKTLKILAVSIFVLFSIFSWIKLYTATVDPRELQEVQERTVRVQRGTEEMPVSQAVQAIIDILETPRQTATTTK